LNYGAIFACEYKESFNDFKEEIPMQGASGFTLKTKNHGEFLALRN